MSAIFWTLGYDTIYGAQDMSDDEIIGLKSTSIKFKENIKVFVFASYSIAASLMFLFFKDNIGLNFSSFFLLSFILILAYQVLRMDKNEPQICLKLFKLNNFGGFIMFLTIISENF
jgi:4-hydroxybenzoate polyprenyltransferase